MTESQQPQTTGALHGLIVIELAQLFAAPLAGKILRDHGARVIKVEDAGSGDPSRHWSPFLDGEAVGFARVNVGKESIAVDLRRAEGRDVVRRLTSHADVLIEAFRPGRLEAWGLGPDSLWETNPRLIVGRLSGFGQTGPRSQEPGFGGTAEAMSGLAHLYRWPDQRPIIANFVLGDSIAGMALATGILAAVAQRERTGKGDEVDVSLYEPLVVMLGDSVVEYTALGTIRQPTGSRSPAASPRGTFQTADGDWVAIAAATQETAARLFEAMQQPELLSDPRFETNAARVEHNLDLEELIAAWTSKRSRDEIMAALTQAAVPASPIYTARDVAEDPHFAARGTLVSLEEGRLAGVRVPGSIFRLAGSERQRYGRAPGPGEHTDDVLRELAGLDTTDIDHLREAGVVR